MSFTTLLFKPMAAIAMTIQNFESFFNGRKAPKEIYLRWANGRNQRSQNKIENEHREGAPQLKAALLSSRLAACLARYTLSASVIGNDCERSVSFTVTAVSKVVCPELPHAVSAGSCCCH